WRDDEGDAGLPPPAARIVSPYDRAARYSRRGQVTRWTGYLAHVTGTCADDSPDVITGVAVMSATSDDRQALAGSRARLKSRGLLPGGHRRRGQHLPGPHGAGRTPVPGHPHRAAAGATRPASTATRRATPAT